MDRRGYLGTLAAAGSLATAGCGGVLSGDGDDGPDTAAANFLRALSEGDTEKADTYLHERHGSVTDVMSERTLTGSRSWI